MSLKAKLISSISAFVLVLTILIVSVWAVSQTQVPLGGTINFQATNVYAKVSATVSGMDENPILPTLTFSEGEGASSEEDIEKWNDLNLVFNSSATPIEISVTVENLSDERSLGVSIINQTTPIENVNISITKNDEEATSAIVSPSSSATFVLTISLENVNVSVQETLYEFLINLTDASQMREINVYSNVEGTNVSGSGLYAIGDTVTISAVIDESEWVLPLGIASDSNYENYIYKFDLLTVLDGKEKGTYSFVLTEDSPTDYYYFCLDTTTVDGGELYEDLDPSSPTYGFHVMCVGDYAMIIGERGGSATPREDVTHLNFPNTTTINGKEYKIIMYIDAEHHQLQSIYPNLESIHIPENLQFIAGYNMFHGLSSLTQVTVSANNNSLSDMGMNVLYDKLSKTVVAACSTSKIPEEATKIGDYAFSGCSSLTSITIPEGVTSIGYEAFYYCSSLTSITINGNITSLGTSAFYNCSKLTSLTLGANVSELPDNLFGTNYLTKLTEIEVLGDLRSETFPSGTWVKDGGSEAVTKFEGEGVYTRTDI